MMGVANTETYIAIAPILNTQCVMCHSGKHAAASLSLDSYGSILKGGQTGKVVKAGDPAASELIKRLKGIRQPRMPMTGPPFLSTAQIAQFESWIEAGMPRGRQTKENQTKENQSGKPRVSELPAAGKPVNYHHVAPIFARRCVKCHTERGQMGPAPEGYLLNSYRATLAYSDRVRVIPGNAAASVLVRRLYGYSRPRMPYDGPPFLDESEIRLIERWINDGARDSHGKPAAIPVGARVRLQGRLASRWVLDGLQLQVSSRTRIDKSPRAGDDVRVRGRVNASGGVTVDRIRRRKK